MGWGSMQLICHKSALIHRALSHDRESRYLLKAMVSF